MNKNNSAPSHKATDTAVQFTKGQGTKYHAVAMEKEVEDNSQDNERTEILQSKNDGQQRNGLLEAVSQNNFTLCEELLNGRDVVSDTEINKCFLNAAQKGHVKILQPLLDHGADIHCTDSKNLSALHLAINQMNSQCSIFLLENGVKYKDTSDKKGNLPIHLAATEGLKAVVQWLLNHGQNPNVKNHKRETPVHLAASNGHADILELLLTNRPISGEWKVKDVSDRYPLHYAALNGYFRCCDILLACPGAEDSSHVDARDRDGMTPLILAAKNGHVQCCQCLKQSDIGIKDNRKRTALYYAVSGGYFATVSVLIDANENCVLPHNDECHRSVFSYGEANVKGSLLHVAIMSKRTDWLQYMLSSPDYENLLNSQDNKRKQTPLHTAIIECNTESAKRLIEAGADITFRDYKDNLPLHRAATCGSTEICKLLLRGDRRKLINSRNQFGETPLHLAAKKGHDESCDILIMKGARLSVKNNEGQSPFHVAAKEGQLAVIKTFKKYGFFGLETADTSGNTPLHLAVQGGHLDCCEFFTSCKSRLSSILNAEGQTPLDESFTRRNPEIFKLLLRQTEKKDETGFEEKLHSYMHAILQDDHFSHEVNEQFAKAIVESNLWYSAILSHFCDRVGPCDNLLRIVDKKPKLAESVFTRFTEEDTDAYVLNAYLTKEQYDEWSENNISFHPLKRALDLSHRGLIQHKFVDQYWHYIWDSYLGLVLYALLLGEIILVIFLSVYINYSWNWTLIESNFGNASFECSAENGLQSVQSQVSRLLIIRILLTLAFLIMAGTEIHLIYKLKLRALLHLSSVVRVFRLFGTLIMVLPLTMCLNHHWWILQTWQWEVGVVTLLASWFYMIHEINAIPRFSVFMPVTRQFVMSFLKVLMYLCLMLLIFALIFSFMLSDKPAFSNIWKSFIKSIVWMLGDLAYDDMFLDDNSPLLYPVMSNVIFILFVTSIGFFISNLLISQPADYQESFKQDAAYHLAKYKIDLMFKYDILFPTFRKIVARYNLSYWTKRKIDNKIP